MNVATGNVWFDHTDAVVPAVGTELVFRRSYNSINAFKNRGGAFGPGWHHSLERTVTAAPSGRVPGLIVRGTDGVPLFFEDRDQDLTYRPLVPATEESWIVARPNEPVRHIRYFRLGGSEEYDPNGRLTAVVDRWGNRTTLTWQGSQLTSIADGGGRALTLGYDGTVLRTLSGPAGLIATYEYNASGLLSKVTYADEQQSGYQFSYWTDPGNGRRLLERVQDLESPVAKTLEFHEYYPGTGQGKTSELGGGQEKLTFEYGLQESQLPPGRPSMTKVTDARGNVTWYRYREIAALRRVVNIEGPCSGCGSGGGQQVQQWAYDEKGHVKSYTDGEGNVTTYTYDPVTGDLLSETRKPDPAAPLELTKSFTYHADGRLKTRQDARGGLTTWTYVTVSGEELEIVEETIDSQRLRTTAIRRNANGQPIRVTDPRHESTEFFYTPQGDLDHIVDPAGKRTEFTYDSMGRRTQVINPPVSPVPALEPRSEYNSRGQVLKVIDPTDSNKFTQFTYDRGGRRIEVRDALQRNTDRRTEYVHDDYGRLQFVRRWLTSTTNQTTEFHYDLMSNLEWIKDARGKQTTFEYDGFNRVKKVFYPPDTTEQRAEEFTYDDAGRLETRKDRRGVITTYSYDGLGRLTGKSYAGGPATAPVTFGYDGAGNLTLADDGSTALSWIHNLTGEPESATQQQLVDGQPVVSTLAFGYDDAGNRTSLDTGLGFSLGYDYDVVGRPWHIVRGSDTFTFGYDDASRRRSLTFPNGVVSNLTPDSQSRLDVLEVLAGTTSLSRFDYDYDDVGNRTRKATPAVSEDYTYDAVYQLDTVRRNTTLTEDYGHDPVGSRNSTVGLPSPSQWVHSNRNELLTSGSATFTYDLNGNLATKSDTTGAWTYEWDAENRLTRVTRNSAEVARYRYDPLGRRVEKLVGAVRTTYVYDGEDILRERVGTSDRYFVHGPGIDEPLARVVDSTPSYFHADGLGSIVSHTNTAGAVVYSRSYDAFGNLETGAGEAGYAFTGREWDTEVGLYYYRARYYDPKVGRFISEDPIGFEGGINFYVYVANRPTTLVDPFGLHSNGRTNWTPPTLPWDQAWDAQRRNFPYDPDPYGGGFRHCMAACLLKRSPTIMGGAAANAVIRAWDWWHEDPDNADSRSDMDAEQKGLACGANGTGTCEQECLKLYPPTEPVPQTPRTPRRPRTRPPVRR